MEFEFRPLTESDLQLLHSWLNRPHVAEWWGGARSLTEVRSTYLPRLGSTSVRPYLVHVRGEPEGFIQSYGVMAEQASGWWPDERDPGAVGIDQFLADAESLGRGIGTEVVARFTEFIFRDLAVTRIQTDPAPTNLRAIRCYEKAGFERARLVETPDGPGALMVLERARTRRNVRIVVSPPGFSDWAGLLALLRSAYAYMESRIDPSSSLLRMAAEQLEEKSREEVLILALEEERVVGCAFARLLTDCVYVGKLAVDEAFRGGGVARKIMRAAEALARAHARPYLELETRIELIENHTTFAALGFSKVAESAHPGFDRPTSITMRRPVPA